MINKQHFLCLGKLYMEITDSNSRIHILSLLNVLFIMRQLNVFIKTKTYT